MTFGGLDAGAAAAAATAEPAISYGATARCADVLCFRLIADCLACLPLRHLRQAQDPEVIEGSCTLQDPSHSPTSGLGIHGVPLLTLLTLPPPNHTALHRTHRLLNA